MNIFKTQEITQRWNFMNECNRPNDKSLLVFRWNKLSLRKEGSMRMLPFPHSICRWQIDSTCSLSTMMVNLHCQFRITEDTGKVYFLGTPDSVYPEINWREKTYTACRWQALSYGLEYRIKGKGRQPPSTRMPPLSFLATRMQSALPHCYTLPDSMDQYLWNCDPK